MHDDKLGVRLTFVVICVERFTIESRFHDIVVLVIVDDRRCIRAVGKKREITATIIYAKISGGIIETIGTFKITDIIGTFSQIYRGGRIRAGHAML